MFLPNTRAAARMHHADAGVTLVSYLAPAVRVEMQNQLPYLRSIRESLGDFFSSYRKGKLMRYLGLISSRNDDGFQVVHKGPLEVLPLAGLLHLADLAQDEFALEAADTVDEEHAVEVVDLVQYGAGEKLFAFDFEPLAVLVLGFDFDPCGALHLLANLGQAEATFFFHLLAAGLDDLGVDEHELVCRVFLVADVDDGEALREGDLGCGEADALGNVHTLEHLRDQRTERLVEDRHRRARLCEHRVGILDHRVNLHRFLRRHCLPDVFAFRTI